MVAVPVTHVVPKLSPKVDFCFVPPQRDDEDRWILAEVHVLFAGHMSVQRELCGSQSATL